MRRRLLIALVGIALVLAAAAAWLTPPAAPAAVPATFRLEWPVARGAFHVHSNRSDGTGTLDEIAAAAAAARLQFVILADHGTGTRPPEAPSYRHGVLCIDAVEISTDGGHLVALQIPQTPYPFAGSPAEVIEDVHRLGGYAIVAHPGSPKPALRWHAWEAPFDGLEWLNADSEWRDERIGLLAAMLLTYPWRPVETLTRLLDRPEEVLRRWNVLTRQRRVPALAGADAHARLGLGDAADPYDDWVVARVPAYEVSFRAFANHAVLRGPLTGDAATDAGLVIDALREGRTFAVIDGLAGLSAFEARASSGGRVAAIGEYLDVTAPVAIEAQIAAPAGTTLSVLRDGEVLYETQEPALRLDVGTTPGAYRIEAHLPPHLQGANVPWLLANPFYVGLRERHQRQPVESPTPPRERTGIATAAWRAEASAGSISVLQATTLDDGTPALLWTFALAGGAPAGQYAALRFPVDAGVAAHDRLQLRVGSDRPRRVWAQLRSDGPGEGERWGHSFYVDEGLSAVDLRFASFRPLGTTTRPAPPLDRIDSLLLVVDTVHTDPGGEGRLWIADLWLAR